MLIDSKACTTAEQFFDHLRRSNDQWWFNSNSKSPWVFRGVGDADEWKLLPSAWRPLSVNKLAPLVAEVQRHGIGEQALDNKYIKANSNSTNMVNFKLLLEWSAAEEEALFQFAELADKIGFDVTQSRYSPLEKGIDPMWQIQRNAANAPLAQHHAVPTRLLDWTEDPLFAAYFASAQRFRSPKANFISVWAFNTKEETVSNQNGDNQYYLQIVRPARARNQFLYAQRGLFTELPNGSIFFDEHGKWPAIEDVVSMWPSIRRPALRQFTLATDKIPDLLRLLDREGVNDAALMPTLDNVASVVIERWQYI